jgi:hypothetical protein
MLRIVGNRLGPRLQRVLSSLPNRFVSHSSSDSDSEIILLDDNNRIRQNQKPFIRSYLETFKYVPLTEHIFNFSGMRHIRLTKLRQDVNFNLYDRNSKSASEIRTKAISLYLLLKKTALKMQTLL